MERLIAWYRVGSSVGALVALIVANLIPLAGVLFLGWSVWQILIIYWLENGIVGIINVLKMQRAQGTTDPLTVTYTINGRPAAGQAKAVLIPFFCLHYGIFWAVHGVFVLTLPVFGAAATGGESSFGTTPDPGVLVVAVIALSISHGLSFLLNFIGGGEYKRVSPAAQMSKPYGRLVVLHVTIIFGAIAISMTGAAVAALAILVVLKIALDVGLHLAEHRGVYVAPPPRSARVT
jgi:Family of unknown function (DUF6498)